MTRAIIRLAPLLQSEGEEVTERFLSTFRCSKDPDLEHFPIMVRFVVFEDIRDSMGHDSIKTTQKYYATYREDDVLKSIFATKNGRRSEKIPA